MPASWNELNYKQLVKLAWLSVSYPKTEAILRFFFYLNNFHVVKVNATIYKSDENLAAWIVRYRLRRFFLTETDLAFIIRTFEKWIYNGQDAPVSSLYKSVFKNVKLYTGKLIAPADMLSNISYEQYTYIDTHYTKFMQHKQIAELDNFIIAMHTANGIFNAEKYQDYTPLCDYLTYYEKLVYIWYYMGCRKVLSHFFKYLFDNKEASDSQAFDPYVSYMKLTSGMAKSPAEIQAVKNARLWDVFAWLDEEIRIHNEQKTK